MAPVTTDPGNNSPAFHSATVDGAARRRSRRKEMYSRSGATEDTHTALSPKRLATRSGDGSSALSRWCPKEIVRHGVTGGSDAVAGFNFPAWLKHAIGRAIVPRLGHRHIADLWLMPRSRGPMTVLPASGRAVFGPLAIHWRCREQLGPPANGPTARNGPPREMGRRLPCDRSDLVTPRGG